MRYQGFLSYSHAGDGKLAPAIQTSLHRIAKPWYRLRSLRIFRDKASLSANPALWPSIEQALADSDFFLLLASPEAAASKWVQQEVGWWLEHRPAPTLLVLLTGGELAWDGAARDFDWSRTTALPANLHGRFADEPLWTDFRWARSVDDLSLRHSQFRGGILDVAAPLLGRPKDEIDGEDVRQHRRFKMAAWIAIAAILGFAVTAAWQAVVARAQRNEALTQRQRAEEQRNIAEERQQIAVSRQLATQADLVDRETSNITVRSLLAVEAARRSQNPDSVEALARSVAVLPKLMMRDAGNSFGLALSPDGKYFAIGIEGKSPQPNLLRVRDTLTGKQLYDVQLPTTPSSIAFTPDSQRIIVGGYQLKILEAATGRVLSEGDPKEHELAISADARLALAESNYQRPRIVDLTEGKDVAVLEGQDQVSGAAFSADGKYLTTWSYGYRNAAAIVFETATGRDLFHVVHSGDDPTGGVTAATFSPDGRYLASGSREHTYVHSVPDGKLVTELPQGSWFVLGFTPDGTSVASTPIFGEALTFYSVPNGGKQRSFKVGSIKQLAFSGDGQLVAVAGDGVARILETETGRELARLKLGGEIHGLVFSHDGRWVAGASDQGTQMAEISNKNSPLLPCLAADISENGRHLLCLTLGGTTLVDTAAPKPITEATSSIVKRGNTGRVGVRGGGSGYALVTLPDERSLWKSPGSDAPVMTFGASDRLAAFSRDKATHIIEAGTGREIASLSLPSRVLTQEFNLDETLLAVSTDDKIVRLFDAASGKERLQIPQDGRVLSLAFAPGNLLAAGSESGALRIVDAASGREVTHMPFQIPVIKLQFSRDGKSLLTLGVRPESEALAARIFDVASTRELWSVTLSRNAMGASASFADTDRTVVSFANFQLQRHRWRADDLVAEACARLDRNLTPAEWRQYLGDEPYRKTCPDLK